MGLHTFQVRSSNCCHLFLWFQNVFICKEMFNTFCPRVTFLHLCFATVSSTMLEVWNSRSMHSSDTAQHTIGVLVFSPRKKMSVYVLINPNCKENLDSSNIHYSNWVEKHRNSLSYVHLFQ